jgi:hypothetical protein
VREEDGQRENQRYGEQERGRALACDGGDDQLVHDDDDRPMRQVQAVRRQPQRPQRRRVEHPGEPRRAADCDAGE